MSLRVQTRRAVINRAMRFDLREVLKLYMRHHHLDLKKARLVERELKRYFALRALHPNVIYGMAGLADDLWHTFLLFTKEYARFCYRVAGRFLHHYPGVVQTTTQVRKTKEAYSNLWRDYFVVFAEPPPDLIWPSLDDIRMPDTQKRRSRPKRLV